MGGGGKLSLPRARIYVNPPLPLSFDRNLSQLVAFSPNSNLAAFRQKTFKSDRLLTAIMYHSVLHVNQPYCMAPHVRFDIYSSIYIYNVGLNAFQCALLH